MPHFFNLPGSERRCASVYLLFFCPDQKDTTLVQ
jgi:hypothetical protein